MRSLRLLLLGFAVGAAAAFLLSLFRKQRLSQVTGYVPPVPAAGPWAVPDPTS